MSDPADGSSGKKRPGIKQATTMAAVQAHACRSRTRPDLETDAFSIVLLSFDRILDGTGPHRHDTMRGNPCGPRVGRQVINHFAFRNCPVSGLQDGIGVVACRFERGWPGNGAGFRHGALVPSYEASRGARGLDNDP